MTIKELEIKTGMTRANIRFYEGEGLLCPKRLDNGYRDYLEEDARTLEKIRLLRQLQLDIDTIRRMQQGTLTLEQALFTQLTRLEGDKAIIERAAEVCRDLECSGVEYATLDPRPYLRQLEAPSAPTREALPPPPPPVIRPERDDAPRACYHPWQRFFARMLDITLYSTVFDVLWLVLTRDQSLVRATGIAGWITGLIALAFALAVEPLWLHFWGWTPGKWLFGLKLRDKDGEKLPLAWGLDRVWRLFRDGYGLDIPFYSLWRFWKNRKDALEGWDGSWNNEHACRYTKEERRFSAPVFVAAQMLCVGLGLVTLLWSMLPPCRGPLGVPEFARNYNHCLRVAEYGGGTCTPTLDDKGQWVEREQPAGTVVFSMFGDTTVYEKPEYTLGTGVTAVTLRMKSEDQAVGGSLRETLVLLSLCRSAGELNPLNIVTAQKEAQQLLNRWENFEEDFRGVHISQQVEAAGYERTTAFGALLWCEDENTPHHCEKTVAFSIIPDENNGLFPAPTGREDRAPD